MHSMNDLVDELEAESADLQGLLQDLSVEEWDHSTAAEGWSIRDQVAADSWVSIAQAFAGAPGPGRAPGQRNDRQGHEGGSLSGII